ncbi:hypothetical protein YC2023_108892 [Brassica napus]
MATMKNYVAVQLLSSLRHANQLFFSSRLFTVVTSSQIAVLASNAVSFHAVLSSSFVLCLQLVLAVSVHRNRLAVFSPRWKIEN